MAVLGVKELSRKFEKLAVPDRGKVLRTAGNAAAQEFVRELRARAPRGTEPHETYKGRIVAPGFLGRNIKKRSILSRSRQRITVFIGPIKEAFYGSQFVEFGQSGQRRQEAQPWVEPGYQARKRKAEQTFADKMAKRIKQIAKQ